MSLIGYLRSTYLAYFPKPKSDRSIYRVIRRQKMRKIVEFGVGDGRRALRMIEIAKQTSQQRDITYVGVDLFEARSEADGPGLSLKAAHQLLRNTGVQVRLLPGNPSDLLARNANSLGLVDLLIVPDSLDSPSANRVWFFIPRMLHEGSVVFVEQRLDGGEKALRIKSPAEIEKSAAAGLRRRAA